MFKKLLSNLPFNPSLIGQVSFYAHRMRQESALRKTGFVLVALSLLVQVFSVVSPAQPSAATPSSNDIIRGGVADVQDAVKKCRSDVQNLRTILSNLNITCNDIATGSIQTIRSTETYKGAQLYSAGRQPQQFANEVKFPVYDKNENYKLVDTIWFRPLHAWDSGAYSSYRAIVAHNSKGVRFVILVDCGNIAVFGKPTPLTPPKPPAPKAPVKPTPKPCEQSTDVNDILSCVVRNKTARNETQKLAKAHGTLAHSNDIIVYKLSVKNTARVTAKQFTIKESMADVLVYADITNLHGGLKDDQGTVFWPAVDIAASSTVSREITVKVKDPIPSSPKVSSDPGLFDLVMTNSYGDDVIKIAVSPTVIKTIETVTTTLPNTGPGESLAAGFVATAIVGYFFARSRLMAEELDVVRSEYTTTEGY